MVGRCTKPDESDQGLRLALALIWTSLYCNAYFLSRVRKYFFLLSLALILTRCSPSKKERDAVSTVQNDLPNLGLIMVGEEKVNAQTLPGKSILIFFGPDCDHCQRQAEAIHQQMDVFKDYSLYFIASNPLSEIIDFSETYGLRGYSNVFFARAEIEDVINLLGPMSVPTLYIYSDKKRLVKKLDKETAIEEIAKFL